MRYFKRYKPQGIWRTWFAWYPVWARAYTCGEYHSRGVVWLEYVYRRRYDSNMLSTYEYEVIDV